MIDADLLSILRCPETHQPLTVAAPTLISMLNTRIVAGSLINRGGKKISESIEGGLLREDRKFLYPIRNRIPLMLVDEGVPLTADLTAP